MVQKYVTTDLGKWGVGVGAPLAANDVDINFWDAIQRIAALEALPGAGAMIQDIVVEYDQMTIIMDDYTTFGPYTLPVYQPNSFIWAAGMDVVPGQMFSESGTIYVVTYPHTTVSPFDPGENDGAGNDYYGVFVEIDGLVPAGGDAGDVLTKSSGTDQDVEWLPGVPDGGSTGYVLTKISATDYDFAWQVITPPFSTVTTIGGTSAGIFTSNIGSYLRCTNATGCTITVQSGAGDIGDEVSIRQAGTGPVDIVGAPGVTIEVPDGFTATLYGVGATALVKKVSTNTWDLMGLLQPA